MEAREKRKVYRKEAALEERRLEKERGLTATGMRRRNGGGSTALTNSIDNSIVINSGESDEEESVSAKEVNPKSGLRYCLLLPFTLVSKFFRKFKLYCGNAGNTIEFVNIVLFFLQVLLIDCVINRP
jgi:hypothetical protein